MNTFITVKMKALAPHVVTKRDIIKGVPGSWSKQYPDTDPAYGARNRDVREKLEALDLDTATAADIMDIIGNAGWTRLACDACEQDREAVVAVPREYDGPLAICGDCATGIAEMLATSTPLKTAEQAAERRALALRVEQASVAEQRAVIESAAAHLALSRIWPARGDDTETAARFFTFLNAGAFLDAAVMLVPENMLFELGNTPSGAGGAALYLTGTDRPDCNRAATPALALTAASLRALAHQIEGEEQ